MALERLELLITSVGGAAVKDIKAVSTATSEASAAQTLLQKTSNTTKALLDQVGLGAVSTGTAFKGAAVAGGALAAVGLAKFAIDSAATFANLAGEVRTFQRASGASAEESSRFVAVLDDMGISSDSGARAIFKLGRELGQGGTALEQFNVATAKNKDGTTDLTGTLLNVADAYTKMRDPAERAALVQAAFGRAGAELVPILEKGRKGLAEFFAQSEQQHQLFTQDDLNRAREYELALDHLSDTFRGFKLQVGAFAMPIITQAAEQGATALDFFDQTLGSVGGSLGDVGRGVGSFATAFSPLNNAIQASATVTELFDGNIVGAAGHAVRTIPLIGNAISGIAGLFGGAAEETNKFADAQSKGQDAVATMNRLASEGKTNTKEYADAERDAQAAAVVLTGANQDVAESLQSVSDKAFAATQNLLGQASASVALSGSSLAVKDAEDKLAQAHRDAADAAQFGIDKSRDVEKAQLAVEQAVLSNVAAAGNLAVLQLGPAATAQDQNAARSKAQREAFEALGGQIDDTTYNRLAPYLAGLGIVPPRVSTDVVLNGIDGVLENLRVYKEKLDAVVGTYVADVIVQSHGQFDPLGGLTGTGIFGDALLQAWPEAAEQLMHRDALRTDTEKAAAARKERTHG